MQSHTHIKYTYDLHYLKYVFESLTFKNVKSPVTALDLTHFRLVIPKFHSEFRETLHKDWVVVLNICIWDFHFSILELHLQCIALNNSPCITS